MRAVLMTASQLASYDYSKEFVLKNTEMGDDLTTHFSCSIFAGFVATTICSPVDVIKTRVMSAKESEGLAGLLTRVHRLEGPGCMFRGSLQSFLRIGQNNVATFLFLEQHKKIYRRLRGFED